MFNWNGLIDAEKLSSFQMKFGDLDALKSLVPNPEYFGCRRVPPPSGRSTFTRAEWEEFMEYLEYTQFIKLNVWFYEGQILICSFGMHAAHESVRANLSYQLEVYAHAHNNETSQERILVNIGSSDCFVNGGCMNPGGQWQPGNGVRPTFVFEISNDQPLTIALAKANTVLHHSVECRYFMVVKIWRHHIPTEIAAVVALWTRSTDAVQPHELQATHFVSIGNRPLTAAELGEFSIAPGAGIDIWVPPVVGVTGGLDTVECTMQNRHQPSFNIVLTPERLFNVPGVATPPHILNLPPLTINLIRTKFDIVGGLRNDILSGRWVMTDEQLQELIRNVNVPEKVRVWAMGEAASRNVL